MWSDRYHNVCVHYLIKPLIVNVREWRVRGFENSRRGFWGATAASASRYRVEGDIATHTRGADSLASKEPKPRMILWEIVVVVSLSLFFSPRCQASALCATLPPPIVYLVARPLLNYIYYTPRAPINVSPNWDKSKQFYLFFFFVIVCCKTIILFF